MADRRRKRRKKKSNSIYKVVAVAVGVCLVALIGLIAAYFISNIDFNFNVKTPGTIAEVKVLPTYESAVTPTEWAELEKNVPVEISQNLQIMMVGDMLMHLNVTQSGFKDDGTKNYDHLFERFYPIFRRLI